MDGGGWRRWVVMKLLAVRLELGVPIVLDTIPVFVRHIFPLPKYHFSSLHFAHYFSGLLFRPVFFPLVLIFPLGELFYAANEKSADIHERPIGNKQLGVEFGFRFKVSFVM